MRKSWVWVILFLLIPYISAEKIEIQIGDTYYPGEEVSFKINLYDDSNNRINGIIRYEILDFYTEIIEQGEINSQEQKKFKLSEDALRGYWALTAYYNDQEQKQLFNVLELEKASITLTGESLLIKNTGNIPYRRPIQITIGDYEETALVPLGIGETKEIKLTAQPGVYTVRVSDGTEENNLIFENVGLTGNVVGLEKTNGMNLFTQYPVITLFIIAVFGIVVAISFLRLRKNNYSLKDKKISASKKKIRSFLFFIVGGLFVFALLLSGKITGSIFYDYGNNFSNGTFTHTAYNGSGIVLSGANLTGVYISRIFDAGANATWNNLSWNGTQPPIEFLFAVDGGGDIYSSTNFGNNWTQVNKSYGRTSDGIYMLSNTYLYILASSNREVWRSDNGSYWEVVNNSFADSGLEVGDSYSTHLHVVDSSGDVYVSSNNGVTWEKRGDFNGAATNNAKGIAINSSGAIFIVDASGDVYSSINNSYNWTQVNKSYGGGAGTDDMTIDSNNYLYILFDKKIYQSTNNGVGWNMVNASFTPYSNDGFRINSDSYGRLYITDRQGRIFQSVDNGSSWQEKGDFNGAASNNPKGFITAVKQTNISFQVRNCSTNDCSDGFWQTVNLSSFNITGRYFQYRVNFSRPDANNTPVLKNVSLYYTLLNTAPSPVIVTPLNNSNYSSGQLTINYTVSDSNLDSCWYSNDSFSVNKSLGSGGICVNITNITWSEGQHTIFIYSNDTFNAFDFASINFMIDSLNPLINYSVGTTSSGNQSSTHIFVNISVTEINEQSIVFQLFYTNGTLVNRSQFDAGVRTINWTDLPDGNYQFNSTVNDTLGHANSTQTRTITIDSTAPVVVVVFPSNGSTSGTNQSLSLNFSVVEINLFNCWYAINGGQNVSLFNCANTTFNVSGDGSYTITVFANDSAGTRASAPSIFTVSIGAPSITLHAPVNTYHSINAIQFNYTPSDVDLGICELWGNFDGNFKKNQTQTPTNNSVNSFSLNLSDGTYIWNVWCNDSFGNGVFDGNKTFYVDTIKPTISLSEPTGTKTNRSNISLQFAVNDTWNVSCLYNVYRGVNVEIANTSIDCHANLSTFNVTVDADFIVNFYSNDSAGNLQSSSLSFTVSTSGDSGSGGSSGGGGGGGGGGSGGGSGGNNGGGGLVVKKIAQFNFSEIKDIISYPGDKKTLSLNLKNTGSLFLNNCKLIFLGNISSWIYSDQVKGIAPGENANFVFDVNVPEGIDEKKYEGIMEVRCDEIAKLQTIVIDIPSGSKNIRIKDVKQYKNDLNISYDFDYTPIVGEDVSVDVWLVDQDGKEVLRQTDKFSIKKDDSIERKINFKLNKNIIGVYTLYFALSSEPESFVKQTVVIGKSAGLGLVIFGGDRGKIVGYSVFVLVVLIGMILILRNVMISKAQPKYVIKKGLFH